MVFLWPENLCSADFPDSPQYCGLLGQVLSSLEQVRMYRMLLVVQVSFPLILRSSFVLLICTVLATSPLLRPVNGQILQLSGLGGGSLAWQISSLKFFPLVKQIIGGCGNTCTSLLSSAIITLQCLVNIADRQGCLSCHT